MQNPCGDLTGYVSVDRARLSIQSKLRTIQQYSKIRKLVLVPKQSFFCSKSIRLNYMMLKYKMKRHFFSCSKFTLPNLLLSHDLISVEANRITSRWVSITLNLGSFGPRSRPTVFATPARVASQSRGTAATYRNASSPYAGQVIVPRSFVGVLYSVAISCGYIRRQQRG